MPPRHLFDMRTRGKCANPKLSTPNLQRSFGHMPPHLGDISTSGKCTDSDLIAIVSFLKTVHTTGSPPGQGGNSGQVRKLTDPFNPKP